MEYSSYNCSLITRGRTRSIGIIPYCTVLVLGKMYPETGIRKIYGRISLRITNLLLVFPDTSYLGQVRVNAAVTLRPHGSRELARRSSVLVL